MQNNQNAKDRLRKQAEAKLAAEGDPEPELSTYEARRLIHELRTHQIELEMQNEALRHAEKELVEVRDRFSDLYDFAPVGYLTINDKGIILQANLTLSSILEVERAHLIGQSIIPFVVDSKAFGEYLHKCLQKHEQVLTGAALKVQGVERDVQLTGVSLDSNEFNTRVIRLAITLYQFETL